MALKTPLFAEHQRLGARIVPFGGWDMPLHYGSQIDEHHAVRRAAGLFDVSHMRPVDIEGPEAEAFLRHLLANDVAKLKTLGKALYSCMLNERGGVIDDLIVYHLGTNRYRAVVNAATADKDIAWMQAQAERFSVAVAPRHDLAMLAVQGPQARALAAPLLPPAAREAAADLAPFSATENGDWLIARTGYTGEDGFEIMLPGAEAAAFWQGLVAAGAQPCGLGARDTLRLEAGMNLYGQDMDETTTPLESGLGWTVAWEPASRDFIGREALVAQRDDPATRRFVGLLLTGPGVLRAHQSLYRGKVPVGEVTSGGFSPTLGRSIGLARVAAQACDDRDGADWTVEIRGRQVPVKQVRPPFVRHGRVCIEL
ncbi:glycine cleavage system T protein [Thioflavicoccus mobilis 8321]|uniref:Aminomethyltransferase n=1 Tax=Thioflavicoccus mobilis 8321 TaxID=765912 RepID=L0GYR0_9GAMM|nr:glycine cleavage system aminomethyltransferase GcvT [Thioflavicoccus mobilis]AGA90454.1 glycine cleavage system T protein [Thioflavicoccus mobilis 8321]